MMAPPFKRHHHGKVERSNDFIRWPRHGGDVDGDGDDDLFVGYHEDQPSELYLWENGSLQTEPIWVTPSKLQVNGRKMGIWTMTEDSDLVVGSLIDNIRMFRNDGGSQVI